MPQKLRTPLSDKSVSVAFRVRRSFGRSRIVLSDGEKELASYRRDYMAPGEMEHIALPAALLTRASGTALHLSCEEVSE